AGLVPGIGGEILVWRELGRVHENRHHHPPGTGLRGAHQGEVALVQGAHRRHESDALAAAAPATDDLAQWGEGANDHDLSWRHRTYPIFRSLMLRRATSCGMACSSRASSR